MKFFVKFNSFDEIFSWKWFHENIKIMSGTIPLFDQWHSIFVLIRPFWKKKLHQFFTWNHLPVIFIPFGKQSKKKMLIFLLFFLHAINGTYIYYNFWIFAVIRRCTQIYTNLYVSKIWFVFVTLLILVNVTIN